MNGAYHTHADSTQLTICCVTFTENVSIAPSVISSVFVLPAFYETATPLCFGGVLMSEKMFCAWRGGEGGEDEFARFTIRHRVATLRIEHFDDKVILEHIGVNWQYKLCDG